MENMTEVLPNSLQVGSIFSLTYEDEQDSNLKEKTYNAYDAIVGAIVLYEKKQYPQAITGLTHLRRREVKGNGLCVICITVPKRVKELKPEIIYCSFEIIAKCTNDYISAKIISCNLIHTCQINSNINNPKFNKPGIIRQRSMKLSIVGEYSEQLKNYQYHDRSGDTSVSNQCSKHIYIIILLCY